MGPEPSIKSGAQQIQKSLQFLPDLFRETRCLVTGGPPVATRAVAEIGVGWRFPLNGMAVRDRWGMAQSQQGGIHSLHRWAAPPSPSLRQKATPGCLEQWGTPFPAAGSIISLATQAQHFLSNKTPLVSGSGTCQQPRTGGDPGVALRGRATHAYRGTPLGTVGKRPAVAGSGVPSAGGQRGQGCHFLRSFRLPGHPMVGGGCWLPATKASLGGSTYTAMKSKSRGRKVQAVVAREPFP